MIQKMKKSCNKIALRGRQSEAVVSDSSEYCALASGCEGQEGRLLASSKAFLLKINLYVIMS